jgi:osmotically-inducible protein OsmY
MHTRHLPRTLIIAAFLAAGSLAAGCASTPTSETAGEYVDSATITAKVKAAFVADKTVSAINVNVETYRGVVQLSGFANSQAEIDQASKVAWGIDGVKSVKNDIRIKSVG